MNCAFLRFEASRFSERFCQTLTGPGLPAVSLEYLEADEGWLSPNNLLDAKNFEKSISCLVRKEIRQVDKCEHIWCHQVEGPNGTHHFAAIWYLNSLSVAQSSCDSCSHWNSAKFRVGTRCSRRSSAVPTLLWFPSGRVAGAHQDELRQMP